MKIHDKYWNITVNILHDVFLVVATAISTTKGLGMAGRVQCQSHTFITSQCGSSAMFWYHQGTHRTCTKAQVQHEEAAPDTGVWDAKRHLKDLLQKPGKAKYWVLPVPLAFKDVGNGSRRLLYHTCHISWCVLKSDLEIHDKSISSLILAVFSDGGHIFLSKDNDASEALKSNFLAFQLMGNASLQVDLHVSFGRHQAENMEKNICHKRSDDTHIHTKNASNRAHPIWIGQIITTLDLG